MLILKTQGNSHERMNIIIYYTTITENTRSAFLQKYVVLTHENNLLSSRIKRSLLLCWHDISHAFCSQNKYVSKVIQKWFGISFGDYIIKRTFYYMVTWGYKIFLFLFSKVNEWNILNIWKLNFVSPHGLAISSIISKNATYIKTHWGFITE